MDPLRIAVRAAFTYIFLLALLRSAGKRTVAHGTPLDFIVALILGDLIDDAIWADASTGTFVAASGAILTIHISLSAIQYRFVALYRLLTGTPCQVLANGEVELEGTTRERLAFSVVYRWSRGAAITDTREIKGMCLEVNGRPSILPRDWAKEVQKTDLPRMHESQG